MYAYVLRCVHMNNNSKKSNERATLTFHTTPETRARLDRLAELTHRSKSYLTNEAVTRYLAEEEDFINAIEQGIAEADSGETISHSRAATYLQGVAAGKSKSAPKPRTV